LVEERNRLPLLLGRLEWRTFAPRPLNCTHVKNKTLICHFNNYQLYKGHPATYTLEFYHYLSCSTDVYWKKNLHILMLCATSRIQLFQLRISSDGEINPLTMELNPSAQRCLTRFFTGDFAS
jgi:hypothetical protein